MKLYAKILCLNLDKSIKLTLAIFRIRGIAVFLDNAIKLVLVFLLFITNVIRYTYYFNDFLSKVHLNNNAHKTNF